MIIKTNQITYLVFNSFWGAYVTADARSQHVAEQPAAQGHSFLPSWHFWKGFSPNSGCIVSEQASASVIAAGRNITELLCRGWSAPSRPKGAHAALRQKRTASSTSNRETASNDLREIKTSFGGKESTQESTARQRKPKKWFVFFLLDKLSKDAANPFKNS